ncbi:MAG TPA: hypothetical protein VN598_10430 [Usitatibacter sp.]|nr:hypothetical protein [Usitatibacter sp.]
MKTLRLLAAATIAALSFPVHAVGHLADVNIVDRTTGRNLPVFWKDGRAYVVGRPGAEYQVAVRNRQGEEVLAVVSVDGLNVMTGETANPRQSGYVLSQWGRVDVRGWRKSLDEVAAFYFTSLGDSYAARTDRPGNVGVIGVALFRRKPEPVAVPDTVAPYPPAAPYEKDSRSRAESANSAEAGAVPRLQEPKRAMPAPSAPLGTGHGRREESRVRWVDFERATEEPAETVAIYYDSYRNLVAMGVLQAQPSPREPNPFPAAFAPDPWR